MNECWIHPTGNTNGYGQATFGGVHYSSVHRTAYEVLVGPVPEGMDLDHECHNEAARKGECFGGRTCIHRRCYNPTHLVVKSRSKNLKESPLVGKGKGGGRPLTYSNELRDEVLRRIRAGETAASISRETGISKARISMWKKDW